MKCVGRDQRKCVHMWHLGSGVLMEVLGTRVRYLPILELGLSCSGCKGLDLLVCMCLYNSDSLNLFIRNNL